MSDLSNLLGDVYGGHDPDAPPVRREPSAAQRAEVPAWADESRLDAVFADWQPGPAPGAPAVERKLMSFEPPPASSPMPPLDDDLAAALSAALVDATTVTPTRLPASPSAGVAPAPSPAASAPAPPARPAASPAVATEPRVAPIANRASRWTASTPVMAPPAVAGPPPQHWEPGDDDIVPRAPRDTRRRGGRRR